MNESVVLLIESADRCMDNEEIELLDWQHIKGYILSDWYISCFSWLSRLPCIGSFAQSHLYHHFSLSYDIIVSFIEAHDETKRMILSVIEDQKFVGEILKESQTQVEGAEDYMHSVIEDMFPEICKAIQHRRASYYLLVHEYNFVGEMLKHGQIEEKEAKEL